MSEHPAAGPGPTGRCPACGARVVAGQDWCSLCLQPLAGDAPTGGGAAPVPPPAGQPGDPGDPADPADPADPSDPRDVGDPRDGVQPPDPADPYAGASVGGALRPSAPLPPGAAEAMLAELAATSAADRPLGRGPLSGTSRPVRTALGCGAGLVLVGVLLTVLWLVGLLL